MTVVCVGPCNEKARVRWARFLGERDAHADEVDGWVVAVSEWEALVAAGVDAGGRPGEPLEPVQPSVSWRAGEPLVCGRCRGSARRALLEVDALVSVLAARADGLRPQSRWSRVSGTRPHGSPSPVADMLQELTGELLGFEDGGRAALRCVARAPGSQSAVARSRAVAWLVERLDVVLAVEGLVVETTLSPDEPLSVVDWALGWESKLRRMVGEEPPGWTPARCRCGDRNLHWDAKVGYFVCSACGNHVSSVEERGLVVEEAG